VARSYRATAFEHSNEQQFRPEPPIVSPIGIEPMTYALRGGLEPSSAVHRVTPALLAGLLPPPMSKVIQGCC
jgi:hypothetical protein